MKKYKWRDILILLGPAAILFLVFIMYPTLRTFIMSFFKVNTITTAPKDWEFVGLSNFQDLFKLPIFKRTIINIINIWFATGVGTISISLLFAGILNSKAKGHNFFKSMVYLPQVISPIAIGYAWILYVFNNQFGMINSFFTFLGLDRLANFQWMAQGNIFWSMGIAAIFGAIGQYTLIYFSAMSNIPKSYYEVAEIEGQSSLKQFLTITLPLIFPVLKSSLVLFTTSTLGFFVYAQLFGSTTTITPMLFTYNQIFGTEINPDTNVGLGAASAVVLTIVGLLFFVIINLVMKDEDYEY